MNRKPSSSLRTFSRFAFVLVFAAGAMTLAGNGVSANEASKDTAPGDFPEYSKVLGYQLQPGSKTLKVKATQILRVVNCAPVAVGPDHLAPLVNTCEGIYDGEVVSSATISDWSVNGVVGGNSTVGTIKGNRDTAIYTAPAKKPTPNTVAVSAKVNLTGSQNPLLVSNITISDLSKYTGTVKFSSSAGMMGVTLTDGIAEVTWTLLEELPDVRTYTASGTISAGVAPASLPGFTCKPVPVTGTIDVSDKLVVYTDRASWNPGTYSFVLNVSDPNTELTATCKSDDGGVLEIPFAKTLLIGVGYNCLPDMTPQPVPFMDPAVLQGTFNCQGSDFFASLDAQWTFTAE